MDATLEQHSAADAGSLPPPASALTSRAESKEVDNGATEQSPSKPGSKRRLFGFGKKKEEEEKADKSDNLPSTSAITPPLAQATSTRPLHAHHPEPLQLAASPQRSPRAMASPGHRYRSSSPHLHSPASSQIFERNVQDSTLAGELSPAIPAHIQTEDHIPPVLEASSLAITDDHLNPDEVEIVMHSAHQPAAAVVTGGCLHESTLTSPAPLEESMSFSQSHTDLEESTSNYGSLDTLDPRRLSFISFADVVQAEHAESNRDALHLLSMASSPAANRSPSPVRSPASSHGIGGSPPASGAQSVKGSDAASIQILKTPGSPTTAAGTHSPPLAGSELTIETMRQALRKTGSGDLSGFRSQPLSATSLEESGIDRPPFR